LNKNNQNWLDAIGLVTMISFELVVSTGIGVGIGYFFFKNSFFSEFSIIVGALLGFTLGLFWVMRLLKKYEQKSKRNESNK
jgi:F0F1-type ATP synthase assembly protein I